MQPQLLVAHQGEAAQDETRHTMYRSDNIRLSFPLALTVLHHHVS